MMNLLKKSKFVALRTDPGRIADGGDILLQFHEVTKPSSTFPKLSYEEFINLQGYMVVATNLIVLLS